MKVTAQHHYDQTIDEVFALFTQQDFYERKFAACGARNVEVTECSNEDGRFEITVEREVPANAPGALKSFLGDWNKLIQSEVWEGEAGDEYYNDHEVSSPGVPVEILGTMNLTPDEEGGCTNHIEVEIKCAIPLLGRKLEQFVAADTEKVLADEYAFIKAQL